MLVKLHIDLKWKTCCDVISANVLRSCLVLSVVYLGGCHSVLVTNLHLLVCVCVSLR